MMTPNSLKYQVVSLSEKFNEFEKLKDLEILGVQIETINLPMLPVSRIAEFFFIKSTFEMKNPMKNDASSHFSISGFLHQKHQNTSNSPCDKSVNPPSRYYSQD